MLLSSSYTIPATPAVTAAELRAHLRIDSTDYDTQLALLVESATDVIERYASKALINREVTAYFDSFDDLRLPLSPASSVSSVSYIPAGEDTYTTLSSDYYRLDSGGQNSEILAKSAYSFPIIGTGSAVKVVYTAGYGSSSSSVPEALLMAVKMFASSLYQSPEAFTTDNKTQSLDGNNVYKYLLFKYLPARV